ncbi:MAG: hypothetical protein NTY45_09710 [Elusimicrobia bacterium]|nr:hypothetical protein [Elusimicrobiota bacterium]
MKNTKAGAVDPERLKIAPQKHFLYAKQYGERLRELLRLSRANGIEPVLITQPLACGAGIDPATGVNLETFVSTTLWWKEFANCREHWEALELYNQETRKAGKEERVVVVDLANELPKDSRLFSDIMHYTDLGQYLIADIIYKDTCKDLIKFSSDTYNGTCP